MNRRNLISILNWNSKEVQFPPKYPFGAKYLLCEDSSGKKFIVANSRVDQHTEIKENHLRPQDKVLGGGCLYYYGSDKGFLLTDSSVNFGQADHEEVKKLLREMYPDVPVEIE